MKPSTRRTPWFPDKPRPPVICCLLLIGDRLGPVVNTRLKVRVGCGRPGDSARPLITRRNVPTP